MPDCLFCKIVDGEIPSTRVYEDEELVAFEDVQPQAPVHVLIVPRKHVPTLNDVTDDDAPLIGRMMRAAARIAETKGTASAGYRTLFNVNAGGGQTVFHLHLHVLGGRPLRPGLG